MTIRRRRSDGVLVEASVLARLLGIRLLRLDAAVVVTPTEVGGRSSSIEVRPGYAPARSSRVTPAATPGRSLAEAVRTINEGAELLADVRRNGA